MQQEEELFLKECRKFALDEAAYATENLDSASEDFDSYSSDNGEYNEKDYEEEEYDFPEPDFSDPGMIPDPHTCLDFVAKYEELAESARECGREDLAEQL